MPQPVSGTHFVVRERPPTTARGPDGSESLQRMVTRAEAALAEPFLGVTTDGMARPGLFPLRATGVSTQPLLDAVRAFLASLNEAQRHTVAFPVDAREWRAWSNIHRFIMRHGLLLEDLSDQQRALAMRLLGTALSESGFQTARDAMRLNETIREITGRDQEFGEWLYWLSIMGEPSEDGPWGWQIDGHHVIVNCFVLGDQVVVTPQFLGSEPTYTPIGKYAGTRVFEAEEQQGLAFMQSLRPEQQARARVGTQLPADVLGTAWRDNLQLPYEGIGYGDLSAEQQRALLDLLGLYVGRIRPGHAEVKLAEVRQHLAETYFAWIGEWQEDSVFYYRIHSPVVLIEFDHQAGVALDSPEPSRQHIHTVVRTPNGNDYGADLLHQHYARHHTNGHTHG